MQFSRHYSKFQSLIFCFNFEPKCAGHCVLARGIRLLGIVRRLFLEPQPEHQCLNSTDYCPYLCLTKEIKGTDLCIEILFFFMWVRLFMMYISNAHNEILSTTCKERHVNFKITDSVRLLTPNANRHSGRLPLKFLVS